MQTPQVSPLTLSSHYKKNFFVVFMQFDTLNIFIMWTFPCNCLVVNEKNIHLEEGSGHDEGDGGD